MSNWKLTMVTLTDIIDEVVLTPKNGSEFSGPCPKCGGKDRFFVRPDDDYCFCRKCNYWANLDKYAWDFNKRHMLDPDYTSTDRKVGKKFIPRTPERPQPYHNHRFIITDTTVGYIHYFGKFGIQPDTLEYFGVKDAYRMNMSDPYYYGYYIPNISYWGPFEDSFSECGGTYRVDPHLEGKWPKYMNEKGQVNVGYYNNGLM